jgi:hypothetical protein
MSVTSPEMVTVPEMVISPRNADRAVCASDLGQHLFPITGPGQ